MKRNPNYDNGVCILTMDDCISAADKGEVMRLDNIFDIKLVRSLALRWCSKNGYRLGHYRGKDEWDITPTQGGQG